MARRGRRGLGVLGRAQQRSRSRGGEREGWRCRRQRQAVTGREFASVWRRARRSCQSGAKCRWGNEGSERLSAPGLRFCRRVSAAGRRLARGLR